MKNTSYFQVIKDLSETYTTDGVIDPARIGTTNLEPIEHMFALRALADNIRNVLFGGHVYELAWVLVIILKDYMRYSDSPLKNNEFYTWSLRLKAVRLTNILYLKTR